MPASSSTSVSTRLACAERDRHAGRVAPVAPVAPVAAVAAVAARG